MSDENRHYCRDIEMSTRVAKVEQRVLDLSERLDKTELHLNDEIRGLKSMIEMIRGQINKLEIRLIVAVILATLAPDLLMKLIGFFA